MLWNTFDLLCAFTAFCSNTIAHPYLIVLHDAHLLLVVHMVHIQNGDTKNIIKLVLISIRPRALLRR